MKKVATIFIYISIALLSFLAVFSLIFSVVGIIYQATNPYYDFILTLSFIIYMVLLLVFCAWVFKFDPIESNVYNALL